MKEELEAVRQENSGWLNQLERLSIQAIASGEWEEVLFHIADLTGWTHIHTETKQELKPGTQT
ncbi:MAG: hypothetical protein F6K31_07395 [Symploca sp. SIO2G7]|nr:hypothetical protein [Symploca sp. SIO2G7]